MKKSIYEEIIIETIYVPKEKDVFTVSTPDHNFNNAFDETDTEDSI